MQIKTVIHIAVLGECRPLQSIANIATQFNALQSKFPWVLGLNATEVRVEQGGTVPVLLFSAECWIGLIDLIRDREVTAGDGEHRTL